MAAQAPEAQRPSSAVGPDGGSIAKAASASPSTAPSKEEQAVVAAEPPASLLTWARIFFSVDPTWLDYLLITVGTLSAAAAGVPFPLMGIIFGELVDEMNGATCASNEAGGDPFSHESEINSRVLIIVYIAIAAFVLIYTYVLSWSLVSQRLAQRLRGRYIAALLRQPPSFFDARIAGGEVSSRLHGDMTAVQAGTSEKVGILIASISFFITAYIIAFIKQPKLAGMLVSLVPAFMIMAIIGSIFVTKHAARAAEGAASASSIASEALTNVTVVQAFGAGPRLEEKFAEHAATARSAGIRKGMFAALQAGMLYFIAYSANALAFWQGSRMVADTMRGEGNESIGQIYTVIFLLVDGMCQLFTSSDLTY